MTYDYRNNYITFISLYCQSWLSSQNRRDIYPAYYRNLFWGFGHPAQQINLAAMVAIWYADDLRIIPWLLQLARLAMCKVRQNLACSFTYNFIGVGLAMTGYLQPSIAALFMVASSLFVTGNSLRLRWFPGGQRGY